MLDARCGILVENRVSRIENQESMAMVDAGCSSRIENRESRIVCSFSVPSQQHTASGSNHYLVILLLPFGSRTSVFLWKKAGCKTKEAFSPLLLIHYWYFDSAGNACQQKNPKKGLNCKKVGGMIGNKPCNSFGFNALRQQHEWV